MTPSTGIWKEGRQGAASLCYCHLNALLLQVVAENHAAVGIRATLISDGSGDCLHELKARNWDLVPADRPSSCPPSTGQITIAGIEYPRRCPNPTYRVAEALGTISGPGAAAPATLPGRALPTPSDTAREAIEAVVREQAWAIWLVDAATLDALGPEGHAALLHWLGVHHARIWCAPIRDIAAWRAAADLTI